MLFFFVYDREWTLRDVCHKHSIFNSQESHPKVQFIIDDLTPCSIISVFDCFWEGSKILGPPHNVFVPSLIPFDLPNEFSWKDLDIAKILNIKKNFGIHEYQELFDSLKKVKKKTNL